MRLQTILEYFDGRVPLASAVMSQVMAANMRKEKHEAEFACAYYALCRRLGDLSTGAKIKQQLDTWVEEEVTVVQLSILLCCSVACGCFPFNFQSFYHVFAVTFEPHCCCQSSTQLFLPLHRATILRTALHQ